MGYKTFIGMAFVTAIFWVVFAAIYAIYYFTGHMADWDSDWRQVLTVVLVTNFVMGPFIMGAMGIVMYWRGFYGVKE